MRELKATDKITQKMTRDGAVSENLATGEVEHISSREPETELSASSEESAGAAADLALRAAEHHEKKKYGWEFLFLGANIDAVETAGYLGIDADRAVNYRSDSEGTTLNYQVVSEAISVVRGSATLGADWKKRIDEDYKKRGCGREDRK